MRAEEHAGRLPTRTPHRAMISPTMPHHTPLRSTWSKTHQMASRHDDHVGYARGTRAATGGMPRSARSAILDMHTVADERGRSGGVDWEAAWTRVPDGVATFCAVGDVAAAGQRIAANIEQVIEGKADTIRLGLTVLLAEGHLLIEDVPGVGKTKFAKALARSIDCTVRRIQFTPDLLPSDITGVSIYNHRVTGLRVQARPGVREHRRRRRDQPGFAEDPGGAAGVHGGAPGHRRRRDVPGRLTVPRSRHAESDRHGRDLPAT